MTPEEARDDLVAAVMEWTECERQEAIATIRVLLSDVPLLMTALGGKRRTSPSWSISSDGKGIERSELAWWEVAE